jgi:hypothetical protein
MGQMENDMSKRDKPFLTFLLCTAILSVSACSTTSGYIPIHEDSIYGITKGDRVPVQWSAGGKIEMVRISSVSYTGISGTGEGGRHVTANFSELYEIGHKPKVDRSGEPLTGAAKVADTVMKGIGYTALGAFGGAMYVGGLLAGGAD